MSEISDLVEKISKLPLETSRKISAFIGAIVGDAACIHLEWIYDEVTLAEKGVIYRRVQNFTHPINEALQ